MTRNAAFFLLASITISLLASSSAPTPLYALYQAQWGFSAATITVIFGVYAVAVLAALLFTGRLSDHVGRRPVLLVSLALQVVTMLFFAQADGVTELMIARIVQGLVTGAALGAVGAGLLDVDRQRGTVANAVAPPLGTGSGALLAGALVHFLPMPTQLVYLVLAAIFALQFAGVWMMGETVTPRAGAWASLKPSLHLPANARAPLMVALPALVATWALAGFFASLGPSVVRGMVHGSSPLIGGVSLFVMAGSAAIAILLLHTRDAIWLLRAGMATLVAGLIVITMSLPSHAVTAFFIGTAIAGAGFGAGFQGAVRMVVGSAAAHERAGVLSIVFITCYLAMGVPAIVAGWFVTHHGGLLLVARDFGVVLMVLAALAFAGTRPHVPLPTWRRRTAE